MVRTHLQKQGQRGTAKKGRTIKTEEKIQRRGSETGTEIGQKGKKKELKRKISVTHDIISRGCGLYCTTKKNPPTKKLCFYHSLYIDYNEKSENFNAWFFELHKTVSSTLRMLAMLEIIKVTFPQGTKNILK